MKILLVEDKHSLRTMLRKSLESAHHQVEEAESGEVALAKLHQSHLQLILTDLKLPKMSGLEVLQTARNLDPSVAVIVMTAYGSVEDAVQAMKLGADDFLQKPVDLDHLLLLVGRVEERQRLWTENLVLREEFAQKFGFPAIVGEHPAIQSVGKDIQKVANTDSTVLLMGESGTGKELFARAVHQISSRRNFPFVTVNCAAIPETLIENELFGHEKGAYTGADERRVGKFELAHKGTLFLDEVGELPLAVQGKLLRALEEKKVERIGSTATLSVDVRIIAATNRDLRSAAERKEFREDLYFRLSVFPLVVPPLRERKSDIPLLAEYFVRKIGPEMGKRRVSLGAAAVRYLMDYRWPGNVRELRNCIERALILCSSNCIEPSDLQLKWPEPTVDMLPAHLSLAGPLSEVSQRLVAWAERIKIEQVLGETGGNKAQAASLLGISYKTLLTKIKEYNL
ncbi:MAG: sigma-54-dependent Fis family transcriptional regulator [Acidobacteria bacterium]|nr:sigma-54-dependent Fis family transcriptional regulator [Acidobacteriota bacterium]